MHIALVADRALVEVDELGAVAAALQRQVVRDFGPAWNVQATVDAFAPDAVPLGYWPVLVRADIDRPGVAGYHPMPGDGTPFALVQHGPTWSLTASHECLEMLVDPSGMRTVAGLSPDGGERVDYLLEVCDPCQDAEFAYTVNGVVVSDFCLPRFYGPTAASGAACSFTGAVAAPGQVLPSGYVSWINAAQMLVQCTADGDGTLTVRTLGSIDRRGLRSLREHSDMMTERPRLLSHSVLPAALVAACTSARDAQRARCDRLLAEIERHCAAAGSPAGARDRLGRAKAPGARGSSRAGMKPGRNSGA